jgi:hypothetical protein
MEDLHFASDGTDGSEIVFTNAEVDAYIAAIGDQQRADDELVSD